MMAGQSGIKGEHRVGGVGSDGGRPLADIAAALLAPTTVRVGDAPELRCCEPRSRADTTVPLGGSCRCVCNSTPGTAGRLLHVLMTVRSVNANVSSVCLIFPPEAGRSVRRPVHDPL